ncbi:MAG TPA: FAD binding domain-containing protein [Xanthobacteraceae bacterium]|jgi:carbon-monoxide dehydrogenase medium subunit|nr:FAD binding domain-containing protein [Xanthobacteraceae bacterium]
MKPASFRYHAPKTVDEAVALLADVVDDEGRILAGGQSLVPSMAFRVARPGHLIDINNIEALQTVRRDGDRLSIGACVRHVTFEKPVIEGPTGHLLATVVRNIAHYPIRTRGTFCGSLANADPASEWCLTAVTLGAEIVAVSQAGRRTIAADAFFDGIMTTTLKDDELLAEVRLPILPDDTRFGFCEFSRRKGDFAIAMCLATYRLKDGVITDPRVGIGGAEPNPRRIAAAEQALAGQAPGAKAFDAAADAAAAAVDPMEDHTTTAQYRRDLVRTMTRRALDNAAS